MTTSAIFNLVLKDERFDQMLTASELLRARLDTLARERKSKNLPTLEPPLVEIEKTHRLYMHSAYKPYVATASEYSKVQAAGDTSGALSVGSGTTVEFRFPTFGHFTSDMVVHFRIAAVGTTTPVIASGGGPLPPDASPFYRYCAWPGLRLIKKAEFTSDSVLIDDYERDEAVAHTKHFVGSDHMTGWARCHGQQEPKKATFFNQQGYTGVLEYCDGLQTPKYRHEAVDLIVPLQFDMCRDVSRALLNDVSRKSVRTITLSLAPLGEILQAMSQGANPTAGVFPYVDSGNASNPTNLPFNKLKFEATLYFNNLYVNPEIHDLFVARIKFQLWRGHRRMVAALTAPEGLILLNGLKWPVEYFMLTFRSRANVLDFDHWWLGGYAKPTVASEKLLVPAMIWNSGVAQAELVCRVAKPVSTLTTLMPPPAALRLMAHGTPIFDYMPAQFYSSYTPLRYMAGGGEKGAMVSPMDASQFLVPLCLYPGSAQPSGHYNLSAGRELYLEYKNSAISETNPAEIFVTMSALNFLVINSDSYQLKYSL
jgi:hypothetical protein